MRNVWTMMLAAAFVASFGAASVLADSAPEPPPRPKPPKEEPKKEVPKKEEPKADEALSLPWTTDEIKKGVKKGLSMTYKVERAMGEQKISNYQKVEITAVTDETYTQKMSNLDSEKKDTGKTKESTRKWAEYMANFKFTTTNTTVTEEKVTLAGIEWDCKVYTRAEKTSRGDSTTKYWFPKDKAGYLVKMSFEVGSTTESMVLEDYKAAE